jgi:membrane-bound lytic murein transglycosylase D
MSLRIRYLGNNRESPPRAAIVVPSRRSRGGDLPMKLRVAIVLATSVAACAQPSATGSAAPTPAQVQTPAPATQRSAPAANPAVTQQASAAAAPARAAKPDTAGVTQHDVSRRATELFGDSTPADLASPTDSGPVWDIEVLPYESTARVDHYVQLFTGPAKERIEARLSDGTRYEPMIRAKLHDGGLPEDLYYLALVESGFDPNAYSRAAAVGMWQFMTSTARDMGLRVDWWVDERRDPVKSTIAAVRFIKDLKEQFGSLYLAAAAYNGGPGRIARGLSRYADDLEGTTGEDLFFALADKDYLRHETREYVPQLIAAALIAKEPDRYGLKVTSEPPLAYDTVRVGPATPLAAIALASGSTITEVQDLNPQLLRGMTPPRDSFLVRIRLGAADSFPSAFENLPASERRAFVTVVSKKGESVASIARKHGLTTAQLGLFNPKLKRLKSGNLAAGQTVLVPTASVAAAASSVPDPSIERYSSSRKSVTHIVRSGETLSGIAKHYHTTTAALMRANGLRRALIFPGQSLVVRAGATSSTSSKSKRPTTKPSAKKVRSSASKAASSSAASAGNPSKGSKRG